MLAHLPDETTHQIALLARRDASCRVLVDEVKRQHGELLSKLQSATEPAMIYRLQGAAMAMQEFANLIEGAQEVVESALRDSHFPSTY